MLRLRCLIKSNLLRKNRSLSERKTLSSAAPPDRHEFFKNEMNDLNEFYPLIAEDLTKYISHYKEFPGLLEKFPVLIDYTVPNDDPYFLTTALIPLYTYKAVEEPDKLTRDNLRKACMMAWVYRILEVSQIIVDDIMDDSDTRYNKPTWFKTPGVTMESAILDSHYLATGGYLLLMRRLADHPCCLPITDLYMENMFMTFVTQFMDTQNVGVKEYVRLVPLVLNKALYIFDGSVRAGLYLANISDPETHEAIKKYTVPMSRFYQLTNDMNGVFQDESKFQRHCPDILWGRNCWLVATALKLANPAQKKIIEEHYGNGKMESAMLVKEVYRELKLDQVHAERTVEFVKEMHDVVEKLPKRIPKQPFHDLVQQLAMNNLYS
ncbi:unnamed protein product [Phyllotreta striolata]|uniref:Terpene synthase n=1 Tax=Phyllotreta striolata TaxID=444603 RepID=A0A9N9TYS4_PHYSR|nr:unnamed protein product [Phyllotreta striolata]